MSLLIQQLSSLLPLQMKPVTAPAVNPPDTAISPLLGVQVSQSQIAAITPAATSSAAQFPFDQTPHTALRGREQHELQSLLRNMQGIEPPKPTGELVDLLVPRPSTLDP